MEAPGGVTGVADGDFGGAVDLLFDGDGDLTGAGIAEGGIEGVNAVGGRFDAGGKGGERKGDFQEVQEQGVGAGIEHEGVEAVVGEDALHQVAGGAGDEEPGGGADDGASMAGEVVSEAEARLPHFEVMGNLAG